MSKEQINLNHVTLDASTVCQLKCPSCPTASGETGAKLGLGYLTLKDFKNFLEKNPTVAEIELSNWGEIFLNKDLPQILAHAWKQNVSLYATNGVNLNHAPDDVLEAAVRYRLRAMNCSIDGASQETYEQYRVNGKFANVINRIETINRFKTKYRTCYPLLNWQYVVFGHNEHEIQTAQKMAAELNMTFRAKLSWEDLYNMPFSPVKNKEKVRQQISAHVADRDEYRQKYGKEYIIGCCINMWTSPQINYDGRVLGCSINYWGDYGNAYIDGLDPVVNGKKMKYARAMLEGKQPAKEGIPCTTCSVYKNIKENNSWVSPRDIYQRTKTKKRFTIFLENKLLGEQGYIFAKNIYHTLRKAASRLKHILISPTKNIPTHVQKLPVPFDLEDRLWKSQSHYAGKTPAFSYLTHHTSVLKVGHRPHPPHQHVEEEILMVLKGEVQLILPEHPEKDKRLTLLKAGEYVYYPSDFPHTLESVSEEPAVYTMLKWKCAKENKDVPLGHIHIPLPTAHASKVQGKISTKLLCESPTKFLKKFHAHHTILPPGAGYKPHRDTYDVVLILLNGEVETLGKRVQAHSVMFNRAGTLHGIHNPTDQDAHYLVFEFHPLRRTLKLIIWKILQKLRII